jgi:hypothetical protein
VWPNSSAIPGSVVWVQMRTESGATSKFILLAAGLACCERVMVATASRASSRRRKQLEQDAMKELASNPLGLPRADADPRLETVLGDRSVGVRSSGIAGAGRGAWARVKYAAGDLLGTYGCAIVPKADEDGYGSALTWTLNSTHVCDAAVFPLHNPMRYVNSISSLETCGRQNARMAIQASGKIHYIATVPIAVGDELLVDYGAGYFKLASPRFASYECHMTPLCVASVQGNVSAVLQILGPVGGATPASINEVGRDGWSPLMEASAAGHRNVVQLLAERGADVNIADAEGRKGWTALHLAAQLAQARMVELLMGMPGVDVNRASLDEATPLGLAAAIGHAEVVKVLLKAEGVDVNQRMKNSATALYLAAQGGECEYGPRLIFGPCQVPVSLGLLLCALPSTLIPCH